VTNRRLALIMEARVGEGKLILTGIDFFHDMETRPASRQLLSSLLRYMTSLHFRPEHELSLKQVRDFIR
jgi:hypothetical protein